MFKVAYNPIYVHPLQEGHRFPMIKYELLYNQLIHEGVCDLNDFFSPEPVPKEQILNVHDPDYYNRLVSLDLSDKEIRKTGFPLSRMLVDREIIIAGGTVQAAKNAFDSGIGFNIAGGTHHAYTTHGEAFCLLNDQAIAARFLIEQGYAKKILIVDLDVHQGNGTAEIFGHDNDVFTFSMHGKNNYPFKKEKSDYDIALEDGTGDEVYLKELQNALPMLLSKEKPDFVFYLSGVDVLETDKLGKLGLTIAGLSLREEIVLKNCFDHDVPVMCSMGGGYSPEVKTVVRAHLEVFKQAKDIFS